MNRIAKSRNPQTKKLQSQYISANKKVKKPHGLSGDDSAAETNQTLKNMVNFPFGNQNSMNTHKQAYPLASGGLEITNPFDTNQMMQEHGLSAAEMQKYENNHPSYSEMALDKQADGLDVKSIVNGYQGQMNHPFQAAPGLNLAEEDMGVENRRFRDREEQYSVFYGQQFKQTLLRQSPDLTNSLRNSNITPELRAKMIDWMLEVISFYRSNCSIYTYFKSILFLDLFIKSFRQDREYQRPLQNSDVHLMGITAIFLASKYEDHIHVDCQKLLDDSAKDRFDVAQVEKMEWKILKDIGFNTTIPSHFEFLECIFKNNFADRDNEKFHKIRWVSILMLIKCLHVPEMLNVPSYNLALACSLVSIKSQYDCEKVELLQDSRPREQIEAVQTELETLIGNIRMLEELRNDELESMNRLCEMVKQIFSDWDQNFPNLKNSQDIFTLEYYMQELESKHI